MIVLSSEKNGGKKMQRKNFGNKPTKWSPKKDVLIKSIRLVKLITKCPNTNNGLRFLKKKKVSYLKISSW
jgi:hypothetical protein